ncbi:MAG: type II secretion system protein [Fibrobacterota bacterium]|nr:type II secretion system protein [Fibrobacterota bacterium]QQS03621.1 MAG: type II secretion system protein [Fibrobacterota bacterium]
MPEILAVIAIIGILAAMAVPRFMRFIHLSRIESTTQILVKDMEWVKLAATRSGTKHYIRFFTDADSSSYEVWKENSDPIDNRFNAGEDSLIKRVSLETPVRIGGQDASVPAAPIAPLGVIPSNVMGIGYTDEICRDDGVVAGQGSWTGSSSRWNQTGRVAVEIGRRWWEPTTCAVWKFPPSRWRLRRWTAMRCTSTAAWEIPPSPPTSPVTFTWVATTT